MSTTYKFNIGGNEVTISTYDMVHIIDSSIIYPKTQSMKDKEIKLSRLVLRYKCDLINCQFDDVMKQIKENSELKALGVKDTVTAAVEIIAQNQELFTVKSCDGYVFQSSSIPVLSLQREGAAQDGRTGFMDLTEARRRIIHQQEYSKLHKDNALPNVSNILWLSLGVSTAYAFLYWKNT